MKAVVGIDAGGHYRPTLSLLARCDFAEMQWILAHVGDDARVLEQARGEALARGLAATGSLLAGHAGAALMAFCDEIGADLAAVQSRRRGPLQSFFLGSTSRALALGAHQSLLICKSEQDRAVPLRAVFATDHSEYCERALNLLIKLGPRGISSIRVLSAVSLEDLEFRMSHVSGVSATPEEERAIQAEVEAQNAGVVDRLRAAGYDADSSAPIAFLAEAIDAAMEETGADLLIMGSQGHGFFERVTLGSSALHQLVSGRHSLLLLRPQ